jgi:hypothetical protein
VNGCELIARFAAAGVRLRVEGDELRGGPPEKLTAQLRTLAREHRAELIAELRRARQPVHADGESETPPRVASMKGSDCTRCANLEMRAEHQVGTRRVFYWRCAKGHALLEGRNFGSRVLLAPAECDAANDWQQWQEGAR